MKILKLLLLIILVCTTCSCTKEKTEPVVHDVVEETKQEENTNNQIEQEVFNEFSVLITAKAINIRNNPDATNKENITGQVYMGETYTVLEQAKDDKYTWYRISEDKWIANDGTWCIEFEKGENKDYPYVMNEGEANEFLSMVDTGGPCYTNAYDNDKHYLAIFGETYKNVSKRVWFEVNNNSIYRYKIGKIVKINDVTYDVFVTPELDYDSYDNSLGCIRISNIGKKVVDDEGSEHPYCNVTFIQNNNDTNDNGLRKLYGIELYYFCSGQVAF